MKIRLIIILLLSAYFQINAQFQIREIDNEDNFVELNIDSVLIKPLSEVNELVITSLSILENLRHEDICGTCSGLIVYEIKSAADSILGISVLRGIHSSVDSVFVNQSKTVYNIINNSIIKDTAKIYSFIIPFNLKSNYTNDTIYVENSDNNLFSSTYVVSKRIVTFDFDPKKIDNNLIPCNIKKCMAKLDLMLDPNTKKWSVNQSEDYFVTYAKKASLDVWIINNWKLLYNSKLAKYFNRKNVNDPYKMSDIIITSYYRSLNRKKINLKEQISDLKE